MKFRQAVTITSAILILAVLGVALARQPARHPNAPLAGSSQRLDSQSKAIRTPFGSTWEVSLYPPADEDTALRGAEYLAVVWVERLTPSRWSTADGHYFSTWGELGPDEEEVGFMPALYHTATLSVEEVWVDELGLGSPPTMTITVLGHNPLEDLPTERDWMATPDPSATPQDFGKRGVGPGDDEGFPCPLRPGDHVVLFIHQRPDREPDWEGWPYYPRPLITYGGCPYYIAPDGRLTDPRYDELQYPYSRTLQELRDKVLQIRGENEATRRYGTEPDRDRQAGRGGDLRLSPDRRDEASQPRPFGRTDLYLPLLYLLPEA